jgi:tRNA pseudouridine55 synthase
MPSSCLVSCVAISRILPNIFQSFTYFVYAKYMTEQLPHLPDEIILVDKPLEWTSFDVIAKIRSSLSKKYGKRIKVGHAGTLDPLATGLLIILVGKATKRQDDLMKKDKIYEVEVTLGQTSTTDDGEGDKTVVNDKQPTKDDISNLLNQFTGEIQQIPPAFSAIKINGKRAYKMARDGQEVKIEPRQVSIYSIENAVYNYPKLTFTTKVSSGTYIRSLARDMGAKLGTGAYMSQLRRVSIGEYDIKDSLSVDKVIRDSKV